MAAEPVPQEARRLAKLLNEKNPALQIPDDYIDTHIHFEGGDLPVQPGCLKSGALCAAAFAAFGAVANQVAQDRYGGEPSHVTINTDHAGYFLGLPALVKAEKPPVDWQRGAWEKEMDRAATKIYPTKDGRWFQLHGDIDCHALFRDIGLEYNMEASREEAYEIVKKWTLLHTADELEAMMVKFGHSGSKCYEPEEWLATDMGKALENKPLINIEQVNKANGPVPYPPANKKRILEGIKVVEMVRIIAGPTIGRTLAELGAQVIKVNPPHLRDINILQYTLTTGTHTVSLDARQPDQKAQLESLIAEADVFIDGFRPGSLERLGFGKERVMQLAGPKGIIYIDENAYGVEGPYRHRPGWQQIADTASGCAVVQGRSLGAEGAVLPPLPISDLVTGVLGAVTVLCGIRDRARHGGNYFGVACLTAYDMFCISKQVGQYPPELVQQVERVFGFGPMAPKDDVPDLLGKVIQAWYNNRPKDMDFDGKLFVSFEDGPFGQSKQLAPVARIDNYPSGWDHPPRPYGYDKPTFDY